MTVHANPASAARINKKTTTNWKKYNEQLQRTITTGNPTIRNPEELEEGVRTLTEALQTALNDNTKTKPFKQGKRTPQYLRNEIREKRRLVRLWQITRDPAVKRQVNAKQAALKEALRRHNNEEWAAHIDRTLEKTGHVFKIGKVLTKKKAPAYPLKTPDGDKYDAAEKAEVFASTLQQVFTPYPAVDEEHNRQVEDEMRQILEIPDPNELNYMSPKEIKRIILQQHPRRAPGHDQISYRALQNITRTALAYLTRIYNAILYLKHFPESWKESVIIMLPKPGKNLTNPSSYRPISLLPTMAKIFERALLARLLPRITMRDEQFGFRPGHSTTLQIIKLIDQVVEAANRGKTSVALSLDNERAFDKVWKVSLLVKLHRTQEIPPATIQLLHSYLDGRTFRVRVQDHLSQRKTADAGVPQGGCLSPILFNTFINDAPKPPNVNYALYADDLLIYGNHRGREVAIRKIQAAIRELLLWTDRWRLKFNPQKTQAIIFGNRPHNRLPKIRISGHDVDWQPHITYLGVTLDRRLTFNKHVETTINKSHNARMALYPLLAAEALPLNTKIMLYKSYIRPILTYASAGWMTYVSDTNVRKLETAQTKAQRTIVKAPWFVRNETLRADLAISTLRDHVRQLAEKNVQRH
uniref:Reverse transcriptase domain-containing protein n=1 Tax=Photinus pyralis TaxID=7054 RepID=A0A1Y1KUU7_PHOPY